MSSDVDSADISSEVATIVQRYRRIERPVSWIMGLLAGAIVATALFSLPLIPALLVTIGVAASVRIPVFRSYGTIKLQTDADAEMVRADFESATPPSLAFQWGLANSIHSTSDGWAYELPYIFGLRSASMTIEFHPLPSSDDRNADFELVVTANERPWGTYTVSLYERDEGTEINIEYTSDRRFGLRRLPQWLVAGHYRNEVLVAQGFTIIERNRSLVI